MKKSFYLILMGVVMMGAGFTSVSNATVFLSGDSTLGYNVFEDDNDIFFQNILEGGASVASHELYGTSTSSDIGNRINSYYNSLSGVSSIYYDSFTLTGGFFQGVDLFITGLKQGELSTGELSALDSYVDSGGSVLFMGEYGLSKDYINDALSYIDSGMSLFGDPSDSGTNTTTDIALDPFTTGVSELVYGYTYGVDGGTSLFFDSGQRAFLAYEAAPVPEPSTVALLGMGLIGIFVYRRRKNPAESSV